MAKTNPTSFLPGNEDGNMIVHTDEDGNPVTYEDKDGIPYIFAHSDEGWRRIYVARIIDKVVNGRDIDLYGGWEGGHLCGNPICMKPDHIDYSQANIPSLLKRH